MRKQIDGLAVVVELHFGKKLDETSFFLCCGRRADRIKVLYWDGIGYGAAVQEVYRKAISMAAE